MSEQPQYETKVPSAEDVLEKGASVFVPPEPPPDWEPPSAGLYDGPVLNAPPGDAPAATDDD